MPEYLDFNSPGFSLSCMCTLSGLNNQVWYVGLVNSYVCTTTVLFVLWGLNLCGLTLLYSKKLFKEFMKTDQASVFQIKFYVELWIQFSLSCTTCTGTVLSCSTDLPSEHGPCNSILQQWTFTGGTCTCVLSQLIPWVLSLMWPIAGLLTADQYTQLIEYITKY